MAFIVHGASFHGGQDLGSDLSTMVSQPSSENALICTGCNNFKASSHDELRDHYKTEWHRHNLKRKVAGLAPIDRDVFEERVASYVSDKDQARGKKKEHLSKKARDKQEKREQQARERQAQAGPGTEGAAPAVAAIQLPDFSQMTEEEFMDWKAAHSEHLEITDSLFDRHRSPTVSENLEYMAKQFGFFIPFLENVVDLEGLVEYLGQKVSIGNVCLWCGKSFHSLEAVRGHMVDKAHCKMCVEGCEEEYQDFYSRDLTTTPLLEDDDEEWETDDEGEMELEGDDKAMAEAMDEDEEEGRVVVATQGKLAEAARMSKKHAKTVSELVVATKVLGHRAFQKYYKQKLRPEDGARRGGEANAKIVGLLTDSYRANGIMTQYKGSSRMAKSNRQGEKQEFRGRDKWWVNVGIKANKFHQVRREDYHA